MNEVFKRELIKAKQIVIAATSNKKRNRFYTKQLRFFLLPMCCYCAFGVFSHMATNRCIELSVARKAFINVTMPVIY